MSVARDPRREVAVASRILYRTGVLDAFGHVSLRHPERADRFLMSRSMAPGLVTLGDVVELDLDGVCIGDPNARLFLERFIHAELYRAQANVGAVAHSHAEAVVPFTVVDTAIRPLAHTCGFLWGTPAPFDVANVRGDGSDLLIRDAELGRSFASHCGSAAVTLMRGHGFTAVGDTIATAVFRAVLTAQHCRLQAAALRLGEPRYLTQAAATACEATTRTQADRAWTLWEHEHGRLDADGTTNLSNKENAR